MQRPDDLPAASDVARAYDRWSVQYDADGNATRDLDADVLRQVPLGLERRDVLELGCGTGKNTTWLAAHARRVMALDFSDGMLRVARARSYAAPVTFLRHDVRVAWPVSSASFDVVVGNLVLEHVEQLPPIFVESARVLRPGGRVFFCELHPFRQWRGGQAHFVEERSGATVHVPAFVHAVSEFVNAGLAAGLRLLELGEWCDAPAATGDGSAGGGSPPLPRLLSVLFEKPVPVRDD